MEDQNRAGYRWETDIAANVQVQVPTSWNSKRNGKVLVVASPDPGMGIELVGITGGAAEAKAVEAQILRAVGETLQKAEITRTAKAADMHGLKGFIVFGKGMKDGQPLEWFSCALDTGPGTGVLAVGTVRTADVATKKPVLEEIMSSIQRAHPAPAHA